jgi:hypothetical protein
MVHNGGMSHAGSTLAMLQWPRCEYLAAFFLFCSGAPVFAEEEPAAQRISTLVAVAPFIAKCWKPPSVDPPAIVEVTVRISFSANGTVYGDPFVTFVTPNKDEKQKGLITASILSAIKQCTPVPFTSELGGAVAGRIFAIRFRAQPQAGRPHFAEPLAPRVELGNGDL